jgi:acetyl esterase/lipase
MSDAIKTWLSNRAYGLVTATLFSATTPPAVMRRRFERFGVSSRESLQRGRPDLAFADHAIGKLAIESVCAVRDPRCAILYLHGGAFLFGSPASYRNRAMRVSYRARAEVFVPDYRLAPEHPFPAALDDAVVAYQYLRALRPALPILVAGDSAGGGLALSLALRLRQLGTALPDAIIAISPWLDLEATNAEHARDRWLTSRHLARWASYYVGDRDPADPLVSPAHADLAGLPPILAFAGEDEVLAASIRDLVTAARRAGTEAELCLGMGMQHDFLLTLPWLAESRRAWKRLTTFVENVTTAHSGEATCHR